jgi:hypothetical protein
MANPPEHFGSFIPGLKRMRMSEHAKLKKHDRKRRTGAYAQRKVLKVGQRHP